MTKPAVLHLPAAYLEQVCAILRQHLPDAEVWAYGSRVNGDHYAASDLDLVARLPATTVRKPFALADVREAFTASNLPIIDWDAIPQAFRDEILAGYAVVQTGSGTQAVDAADAGGAEG